MHTYCMVGVGLFVIALIANITLINRPVYQRDISEILKRDEDDY